MNYLILPIWLCFANIILPTHLIANLHDNSITYIDPACFQSIDDLIQCETLQILKAASDEPISLSEKYLSRAESYLLSGNHNLAFFDFQSGYEIANACDNDTKKPLHFRALFGLAIIYGQNDMFDEFDTSILSMKDILNSYPCSCNPDNISVIPTSRLKNGHENKPIYGPDKISKADCAENARATARACRNLITFVKKSSVQVVLNILIDDLETRALNCCYAGGLWKACLGPIIDKWHLWNTKWNVLGIPPDPAWD